MIEHSKLATERPPQYTSLQLDLLDKSRLPKHIAIIPDGNRRWAKNQQEQSKLGHRFGANTLIETVRAAKELGIETVTFFLFSTENWNRSKEEINFLMWLLQEFLIDNREEMCEMGVKFHTIGDLTPLPKDALDQIELTKEATKHCSTINMVVALNYGARDEMRRAIAKIAADAKNGIVDPQDITERQISSYLDTALWGDPDLFIRTSGEHRISNYLLWQMAYTEIYFSKVLWPDFKGENLLEAVLDFQKRERRWGGS